MKKYSMSGFEVTAVNGDGRGETHVAHFSNQGAAELLASTNGAWMRVRPFEKLVVVYETYDEYCGQQKEELRAKALAKLTAEEREALGV